LTDEAVDLILKLVCDHENRLGINGATEIKEHPWFDGINWGKLKSQDAPFVPEVSSSTSSENFDKFKEEEPFFSPSQSRYSKQKMKRKKKDLEFVGYTYKADVEEEKQMLASTFQELKSMT